MAAICLIFFARLTDCLWNAILPLLKRPFIPTLAGTAAGKCWYQEAPIRAKTHV